MKFTVVCTLAAVATPLFAASAQKRVSETPAIWSLSVGIDPSHLDLRTRDPGVDARFVGTLTRSWGMRFERLRLKAELMAGLDAPRGFHDADGTRCGGCDVGLSRRFASAGVGATFQLLRNQRLNPYVTGGTGIYHNRFGAQSSFFLGQSSKTSLGLNGGAGVAFRLGGREFFVQQSAHVFDFRGGQAVFPLSLGIRF